MGAILTKPNPEYVAHFVIPGENVGTSRNAGIATPQIVHGIDRETAAGHEVRVFHSSLQEDSVQSGIARFRRTSEFKKPDNAAKTDKSLHASYHLVDGKLTAGSHIHSVINTDPHIRQGS